MLPLENPVGIIVNKARQGCRLSEIDLAQRVGLTAAQIVEIETSKSNADDATLRRIALVVKLHPDRLVAIAHSRYMPAPVDLTRWDCIAQITLPHCGVPTHAYLAWDDLTKEAVLFDTGARAEPIHELVQSRGLRLGMVCLTHTHEDHVEVLPEIRERYQPLIIASPAEPVDGARFVREDETLRCGSWKMRVLETDGHSPGGLTFVLSRSDRPLPQLAVVGDAIFAGSIGGPKISFERVFSNVRDKILTLPDDTVLLPGHGPLMTVREEKENNPFFA